MQLPMIAQAQETASSGISGTLIAKLSITHLETINLISRVSQIQYKEWNLSTSGQVISHYMTDPFDVGHDKTEHRISS